jgi:hypothetical protein
MPIKIGLFPLLSRIYSTGMSGITFTLSSKVNSGGNFNILGAGGNQPINAIFTGAVSVISSGTANSAF